MSAALASFGGYLKVLGLGRMPFPTTPDAACYFRTPLLEEEMAETVHCVMARKGFVLVTGEIGLGKSTFVRHLTDTVIHRGCVVSMILNTFLRGEDLLRAINNDFGIAAGQNFADDVAQLNAFLVEQHASGCVALIIIDDAQNMCLESLELLRMLSNFETNQEKLVQILLCGQPELVATLATPSIRQLTSRIVKHVELRPMRLDESRSYVTFRLAAAGADGSIAIAPMALRALHQLSGGNPRRMHLILDRCLYGLVAERARTITLDLVRRAAAESGIRKSRTGLHRKLTRVAIGVGVACLATVVAASILTRQTAVPVGHTVGAISTGNAFAATPTLERPVQGVSAVAQANWLVAGCLKRFGLVDHDDRIEHALAAGDLGVVRTAISQQNPALTVLAVPARVLIKQSLEGACVLTIGEPMVLVWHPRDALEAFAFGTKSTEVHQLQQRLAEGGYYHDSLDGVAGPRTVTAIADFQHGHELAVTGYPDALTRFVIERETAIASSRSL